MTDGQAVRIQTNDGAQVGGLEYGRHQTGTLPSIFFIPAMGVAVSYYDSMLSSWSREYGRHIMAVELRGMPLSFTTAMRRERFGYSTLIRDDFVAFVQQTGLSESGFVVVGHSLGGQLALLATAADTIRPQAVVMVASGTSSPASQSRKSAQRWRRAHVWIIRAVSAIVGFWPGDWFGFGGRQPRTMMADWTREAHDGGYALPDDAFDYEIAIGALTCPALMVSLEGDRTIPLLAVNHLRARLPDRVQHVRLASRASTAFDHLRWARSEPDPVIEVVEAWLTS